MDPVEKLCLLYRVCAQKMKKQFEDDVFPICDQLHLLILRLMKLFYQLWVVHPFKQQA